MNFVPKLRQVVGNPSWSNPSTEEARALINAAKSLVKHGTGFTHSTVAVLEKLLWSFRSRQSGVCLPSRSTLALAARICVKTVDSALIALTKTGLIRVHRRFAIWTVAGIDIRVATSHGYTFHPENLVEGVGKISPSNPPLKIFSTLREGVSRQMKVAQSWIERQETSARRSVALQLLLLNGIRDG
jgi:hypothetical protein